VQLRRLDSDFSEKDRGAVLHKSSAFWNRSSCRRPQILGVPVMQVASGQAGSMLGWAYECVASLVHRWRISDRRLCRGVCGSAQANRANVISAVTPPGEVTVAGLRAPEIGEMRRGYSNGARFTCGFNLMSCFRGTE
jgi:hypothetical protein